MENISCSIIVNFASLTFAAKWYNDIVGLGLAFVENWGNTTHPRRGGDLHYIGRIGLGYKKT